MLAGASAGGARSTIVVADSLAKQLWEMHLAAGEIRRGTAAWATPRIVSYAAWLEQLWLDTADARAMPLTVGQSAALWRRVLAESTESSEIIGQAGAAEWAADAWRLLQHWQIDPAAQRARADESDYRAFLSWCRSYRERLDTHAWLDRAELDGLVVARGGRSLSGIVAADLAETYPAREALFKYLEREGVAITRLGVPVAKGVRRAARLAAAPDELRAAVAWARRQLAGRDSVRVAVVVPDAAQRHDEIERVVAASGLPFGSSEGRALDAQPAIGAACNALALLAQRAPYAVVGRWLRSPFFVAAESEAFARAELDRRLRAGVLSQLSFGAAYRCGLKETLEARAPQSAAALARALAVFGTARQAYPGRWAHLFTQALAALGWQPRADGSVLAAWQASLDALAKLTPILGEVSLDTALAELGRNLQRAPGSLPVAGIHVLRDLRSVGPGYDAVWVTGFTDVVWPEPPQGNPLLPLRVQRAHALPYSSPQDARQRSAQAFERLVQRVPNLVVSWPARVYDYEAAASPAIRAWPELTAEEIDELVAARSHGERRRRETVPDAAPAFVGQKMPGGTGALRRQARCPVRAFVEYRLAARELEPLRFGLSPSQRGMATHRAAELLLKDLPAQSDLVTRERSVIAPCVAQALTQPFGRARAPLAGVFALEAEQLERVLTELLRAEETRSPFRVRAVEQESDVAIGRWLFSVRVDRIDELADGSMAIIDYKTSDRATSAPWLAPRLGDAQVPLYACSAQGVLGAAVIARLTPAGTTYSGLWRDGAFPGRRAQQGPAEPGAQLATWRAQLLALAEELAAGDTRIFLADYRDAAGAYAPLTRVFEQLALARGTAARW